jgi:hypothetical protein
MLPLENEELAAPDVVRTFRAHVALSPHFSHVVTLTPLSSDMIVVDGVELTYKTKEGRARMYAVLLKLRPEFLYDPFVLENDQQRFFHLKDFRRNWRRYTLTDKFSLVYVGNLPIDPNEWLEELFASQPRRLGLGWPPPSRGRLTRLLLQAR